jgi:hypothetical protein|tara:strand:- start:828 stop:1010 length:183 start_codon:yes stop_codon:yes gene_type:complete
MNFTKQQKEKIQELLKIDDNEAQLMELKKYLATFKDQLSGDFAQIAYNIYLEHKGLNKNK